MENEKSAVIMRGWAIGVILFGGCTLAALMNFQRDWWLVPVGMFVWAFVLGITAIIVRVKYRTSNKLSQNFL